MVSRAKRQTVVVVDDEPGLRLLVRSTIDSPEYEVIEAADGIQAWALIKERKPELVLLDLNIPRLSGLAVLAAIRADPELRGTQVILLTSSDNQADIDAGILAGADFYLTKPFLPHDLFNRVAEAISQRTVSSSRVQLPESTSIRTGARADTPDTGLAAMNGHEHQIPAPELEQGIRLGRAIAARCAEATEMTAKAAAAAGLAELSLPRFARASRHVHNLATVGIARLLMTGRASTEKERNFVGRLGVMAATYGLSVATLTRSYLMWRDTNLRVLDEEADRLGTEHGLADRVRAIIRANADIAIVRMTRAYDFQMDAIGRREDAATVALNESEARLQAAVVDITMMNNQLSTAMAEISSKNEQLLDANRQQADFIANVSHELRTPLADILGCAELVLGSPDAELGPQQREDVDQIQTSGRLVLRLVNDILDESLIEAGRITLDIHRIDLKAATETVASMVRSFAENKGLYLSVDVPDGAVAMADEVRLKQVLTNLIGNAIKFTDAGGVSVKCSQASGLWRFTVCDTGIGLPRGSGELVFERFRQLDPGTTRRFGGAGLGLTIARGLVRMQGGEMGVESEAGQGSTFWFTVPAFPPNATSPVLARGTGPSPAPAL